MSSDEKFQQELLDSLRRTERNTQVSANLATAVSSLMSQVQGLKVYLTGLNILISFVCFALLAANAWITFTSQQRYRAEIENIDKQYRAEIETIKDKNEMQQVFINDLRQNDKVRRAIEDQNNE